MGTLNGMMRYLRDAVLIIGVGASLIATADAFQSLGNPSGGGPDGRRRETPVVVVDPSVSLARACEAMVESERVLTPSCAAAQRHDVPVELEH